MNNFQAVRDEVMRRIEGRIWEQGDVLPTEQELSEEFGCARATVNRAMRELAERGVVDRKRKSGTRVATQRVRQAKLEIQTTRKLVEDKNASYRYALVSRSLMQAPGWLSSQMALPCGAEVLHLEVMHFADEQAFHFEDRWINVAAVPDCAEAEFTTTPPGEWLLAAVPYSNAEVSFGAIAADAPLAEFLACAPGTPLFQIARSTWYQDTPVTFARLSFHPGYRMRSQY